MKQKTEVSFRGEELEVEVYEEISEQKNMVAIVWKDEGKNKMVTLPKNVLEIIKKVRYETKNRTNDK